MHFSIDATTTYQEVLGVIHALAALVLQEGAEAHGSWRLVQHYRDKNDHSEALALAEGLEVERGAKCRPVRQRVNS